METKPNLVKIYRTSEGQSPFMEWIDYGPGYRIYCGKKDKAYVLLLFGGSKASQRKDIEKAKRYWEDFQKRIIS